MKRQVVLIASLKKDLNDFKYQVVLKTVEQEVFLNAVNIIFKDKIVKKIKKADTELDFEFKNAENIASDFISKRLKFFMKNKKTKASSKAKAAKDLMKTFNL
jgi:lysyl-tRNA synthetase class I